MKICRIPINAITTIKLAARIFIFVFIAATQINYQDGFITLIELIRFIYIPDE